MLYVLRHGRTTWNAEGKLQGSENIPLNEEGVQMAIDAGVRYCDISFDVCFVSPLDRAQQTAKLFLGDRQIPLITDERLREISFGIYEGQIFKTLSPDCPALKLLFKPEEFIPCDGIESIEELYARTGEFLQEVVTPLLDEGKNVLIVGHGAMNCSIINRYRGVSKAQFWDTLTDNCVLTKIV